MITIYKCEEFRNGLKDIADTLENYRCKVYQEKVCSWEEDKQYVDDRLFALQSQIRDIYKVVELMEFEADQ